MRPRRKPSGRWSRSGMRQPKAMTEVRDNIDRLDRQIVALLAERTGYVRQAARVKLERGAIVDPERIEDVVAKVRKLAAGTDMPPDMAEAVYRKIIACSIEVETRDFDSIRGKES